VVRNRK